MKTASRSRKPRLELTALDRRDLPSGVTLTAAGTLNIDCGTKNDAVTVSNVGTSVKVRWVATNPGASIGTVYEKSFAAASVKSIYFHGREGNDTFTNLTALPSRALGDDGIDVLVGGDGADWFSGGNGRDTLTGGGGVDTMLGSGGNDRLDGGPGADLLYGGTENDVIQGGTGEDIIYGDDGNDSLYGGANADRLYGGTGNDTFVTVGGGTDTVTGNTGYDSFWADPADVITDATATEVAARAVHRIDAFARSSYDGGVTSSFVSKELNGQDLADPWRTEGEMELLYTKADFSAKPLFMGGPTKDDIFQGSVGDCYLMASLSAIADAKPDFIRQMVADMGDGTYAVRFYRDGVPVHVRVDGDLWVNAEGNPLYAKLGPLQQLWVPIVEKAWAFFRYQRGNYESIAGGDGTTHLSLGATSAPFFKPEPVAATTVVAWHAAGSPAGLVASAVRNAAVNWLNLVKAARAAGNPVIVGAVSGLSNVTAIRLDDPATEANENTYRRGQHVYMVDTVLTDAGGTPTGIRLRDPYGAYRTITDMTRVYFCLNTGFRWGV